MLWNSAFTPLEVRTHYRGVRGPKQSLTIFEAPLWQVSNSWQGLTEIETVERNKTLTDLYRLPRTAKNEIKDYN